MWWVFLSCFVAAAAWFPGVESQRRFTYDQRFTEIRPVSYSDERRYVRHGVTNRYSSKIGEKVRLDVYYETNCPDSMRFINRQLYPLYKDMKDVVDINLIPFGKASESYNSVTKKYDFRCHHGQAECYGNTVQSCAISLYPNIEDHLELINCMEMHPRPSDSGQKCARRLSMDWKKISKCADGDEGNKLLHEHAQRTTSLSPPLYFVPWIVVNNVYSDANQRKSLRNLKGVVCDLYKERHPKCGN